MSQLVLLPFCTSRLSPVRIWWERPMFRLFNCWCCPFFDRIGKCDDTKKPHVVSRRVGSTDFFRIFFIRKCHRAIPQQSLLDHKGSADFSCFRKVLCVFEISSGPAAPYMFIPVWITILSVYAPVIRNFLYGCICFNWCLCSGVSALQLPYQLRANSKVGSWVFDAPANSINAPDPEHGQQQQPTYFGQCPCFVSAQHSILLIFNSRESFDNHMMASQMQAPREMWKRDNNRQCLRNNWYCQARQNKQSGISYEHLHCYV